jgi:site-specific recombinase XerD
MRPQTKESRSVVADVLSEQMEKFLKRLQSQDYAPSGVAGYRRRLNDFRAEVKARDIPLEQLDENRALELFAAVEQPSKPTHARFMVRNFIRFLIEQGVVKLPLDNSARACLKRNYEQYLRRQRGLSERTIFHAWRIADRFLTFRSGDEIGELSGITAHDIVSFMQAVTGRRQPPRDKTISSHLRNFFRYLFKAGKTTVNLALGIPSVAQRFAPRLPRHLTAEEIEKLLEAVKAETTTGRRNHAMVLLIARLGLRAAEVVKIQIDDIAWRAGELLVRGKGQLHDRLPLPPDVGEALAEYVRLDRRSSSSRALFVKKRPPHVEFKDGQVLNNILRRAYARTGLKPPVPYVGSHILRHSLATALVRRGASLEEIGDMLRHRSRASTMIYAKLDIDGLRMIAQPWPVEGGTK